MGVFLEYYSAFFPCLTFTYPASAHNLTYVPSLPYGFCSYSPWLLIALSYKGTQVYPTWAVAFWVPRDTNFVLAVSMVKGNDHNQLVIACFDLYNGCAN